MVKLLAFWCILMFGCVSSSFAQEDAAGCKDHPMFNRLPNFLIMECIQNFNAVDFQVGKGKKIQNIEGNVTRIAYGFNAESGAKQPSPLQIVKNYENAIVSHGGHKVYSGVDDIDAGPMSGTYSMTTGGKEYWVTVRKFDQGQSEGEVGTFDLYILEKEAMTQDVTAASIFDGLNTNGSVALYINFETGKSAIKSESQTIVDQVAAMLVANPTLKISVEGHTDNVGKAPANLKLSDSRANAVMAALIAKGIDKSRLSAKGWGQEKPLEDNSTEDGRAKNRRVEIVKVS